MRWVLLIVVALATPGASDTGSAPVEVRLERELLAGPDSEDHDGDGLADDAEALLADQLRPFFVFDSDERHLRPGEPVTLFQVRPVGCVGRPADCAGAPLEVVLRYLMLWRDDGGYGPSSLCRNEHAGDNQHVEIRVESDDGRRFRVSGIRNGVFRWPGNGAPGFHAGTHLRVYLSAGKHHQFFDTRFDDVDSPYSRWACNDDVDGEGAHFVAELRGPDAKWNHVGEPERHPDPPFVGDLSAHGFAGEHAHDPEPFCGGIRCTGGTTPNATKWSREPFWRPGLRP